MLRFSNWPKVFWNAVSFCIFFKYFAKTLLQSIILIQFLVRTALCDQTSSVLGKIWNSILRCHYSFPIDSSRVTAGHEIEIAASSIFLSFFKLVDSGLVSKPYSLLLHAKKKPFECSDNARGPFLYYVSKVTWWWDLKNGNFCWRSVLFMLM